MDRAFDPRAGSLSTRRIVSVGEPSVETAARKARSAPLTCRLRTVGAPLVGAQVGGAGDDHRPDFVPFLPRLMKIDELAGTSKPAVTRRLKSRAGTARSPRRRAQFPVRGGGLRAVRAAVSTDGGRSACTCYFANLHQPTVLSCGCGSRHPLAAGADAVSASGIVDRVRGAGARHSRGAAGRRRTAFCQRPWRARLPKCNGEQSVGSAGISAVSGQDAQDRGGGATGSADPAHPVPNALF
jgi:hypothetical protein